jgi:hypothetical protein
MTRTASPRVLALNIAAGTVYGAVVVCPDWVNPGSTERSEGSR